jgi:putative iron-regulated protein
MKKLLFIATAIGILSITSCKKNEDAPPTISFDELKTIALKDFTNNVAVAGYADLDIAATNLNTAIQNLNTNATEANLTAAKTAWINMRGVWEQCEGFLFGPVEDNDYDPNMDTWPTDYVQMDSLLNSSNPLAITDIQSATLSLRGYHPIEYIIFGNHGNRLAASITARQKQYMLSLSEDLKSTCHQLYLSWTTTTTNFSNQVINAGTINSVYSKKQEVYLAIVNGLIAICEEVGEGKMKEPFDAMDPSIVESPYSGNSITDFKNNIIGLQNVYLGKYAANDGKGINDLVSSKNIALDNKIQSQITAAISSFSNITSYYEDAIISQRLQCQQTMTALNTLKGTLENELKPFVIQYIID